MTETEYDNIISWVEVRWPHLRWTSVTVAALFKDLSQFDATDVHAACHKLYEQGREHPPTPSLIVAACLAERKSNAARERMSMPTALPSGADMYWPEYAVQTYGEAITFWEAVKRRHGESESCLAGRSQPCDVHV